MQFKQLLEEAKSKGRSQCIISCRVRVIKVGEIEVHPGKNVW